MISFEEFHMGDDLPIYQQIVRYIKGGVVSGSVLEGDELPSRRMLSALLGVNPNTVQKAYRQLEEEGLIQSRSGAKSFVVIPDGGAEQLRQVLLRYDIRRMVLALQQTGVSKEEALTMLNCVWEDEK